MDRGEIKPAMQQAKGMVSEVPLEWVRFGITFSAALPGFLKPKALLLLGRKALLPLLSL